MNFCRGRRTSSWSVVKSIFTFSLSQWRHGRACPTHPRLSSLGNQRRGSRHKTGHDAASQPHLPAGEVLHDFLGAAADRIDLDLAVDALDFDTAHETSAAENLYRLRGAERH